MSDEVTFEDTPEFSFDDFFVSQDIRQRGIQINIELEDVNGNTRSVPITLKRGLSFGDQQAAKENSVKKRIKPDGSIEIVDINEDIFAIELVTRGIKDWPFRYANGNKVPVTRESVKLMLADGVSTIASMLTERITKKQKANAPFTPPSEQS